MINGGMPLNVWSGLVVSETRMYNDLHCIMLNLAEMLGNKLFIEIKLILRRTNLHFRHLLWIELRLNAKDN